MTMKGLSLCFQSTEIEGASHVLSAIALCLTSPGQRPYERLEYLLWIWELWQPLRGALRLEKHLDQTQAALRCFTFDGISMKGTVC